jgi:hypothetical protein
MLLSLWPSTLYFHVFIRILYAYISLNFCIFFFPYICV